MIPQNNINKSTSDSLEEQILKARNKAIDEFEDFEHRLEFVDEIEGIEYINDSKATNVNSTAYSLEFMKVPVVWIATVNETETDYFQFADQIKEKVKAIVCLGSSKEQMNTLANEVELFKKAVTIEEAVTIATSFAHAGDIVLFSPGCSDDRNFQNYKEKGIQFRKAVENLNDW